MRRKFSNFVDLLSYRASEQSEKIVFTFLADGETEAASLTYYQLDERARAIAAYLQSLNASGERALLLYQPGLEFIAAFFGCLYAGVIAVPAYPPRANRSLERLQAIVSDAQANFALTTESLLSAIEGKLTQSLSTEAIRCITTDNIDSELAKDYQVLHAEPENLAFLQYTSGSTGTPKGVMVSHGNLIHNSDSIHRGFRDTEESKGVSWLPPYHDMGLIGGILQPIYVGAFQALMPPVTFLQRPLRWLQAISNYGVTTAGGPNFAYDLCVSQIAAEQRDGLDLSRWTLAFTGAEPVRANTIEQFAEYFSVCGFRKEAFYPCYGMAETTLIVTGGLKEAAPILTTVDGKALETNQVVSAEDLDPNSVTLVSSGKSALDQQVIIVNPQTFEACQENEIGEIWAAGESIAQGYWNREIQTKEVFQACLAGMPTKSWLRTGDLGFLRDGELFVTGRLKDLIIIRGRNHYPQDIELTTEKSHEALREACGAAFSVEVDGEERLVITYEVKRTAIRKLKVEEVASAIRKAIVQNHELQPFAILLLKTGSIPKTSSGKIQRHACKAGFLDSSLSVVGEWKQGAGGRSQETEGAHRVRSIQQGQRRDRELEIQAWLVENIARRLGIAATEIDVEEPFVSYGLDSVQGVRLTAELEDWLGRKLSPTLAYDYPSIAALASYLVTGDTSKNASRTVNSEVRGNKEEAIAIVGIGCRFPGAKNPEAFWQLLRDGKDAISPVRGRWQGDDWGGFLTDIDRFDPQFFGISPREANEIDPQQRLLLEVSWEALENAGIAPDGLAGSLTGVFIGISGSDYSQLRLHYGIEPDAYAGTGNAHSIAANRLSYFLDLRGPSMAVDTACSSSLVAVHLAAKSLQNGECDRAIAGGVNLLLSPELTQTFRQAGMMSAEGRCKTFDAAADGYVRGEGCGVAILKRLSDAVRDGDNILATICGSAINQDGRSNGLTAPNGLAQQAVIDRALQTAGVTPVEIDYVETHGTGTALGDPIEFNSLKTVLMQGRSGDRPLWLGALKTNIGHLEAAAGIAGLIKVVLCLQHEEIPPNLHFSQLNPHIDLQDTAIAIPTQVHSWLRGQSPRLAGVSSFGFGGTNAHVVLQEGEFSSQVLKDESDRKDESERPSHLLTLSAKSEEALQELVKAYRDCAIARPTISIENLAFTANMGRGQFNHRLAIIADSLESLQERLTTLSKGQTDAGIITGTVEKRSRDKIAFLFTGQGSQYVGMGYQLYQTQPTFRTVLDRCAEILQPYLEKPLLEILYGDRGQEAGDKEQKPDLLDRTAYTQPALFALEYALAQLWMSWGIVPSAVLGHSVGEYVAACLAGVFSLEDGLKLIARRAKLMQSLPDIGQMVVVLADAATVETAIQPYTEKVAIAAINGSRNTVISGEKEAIKTVIFDLKKQGIKTIKLKVSHAFHSPLMEPILEEFERVASQINYSLPRLDIISNLTGKPATAEIATPQYWVDHVRQAVRFSDSIEYLDKQGYQIFLEIGSQPTLLSMGRAMLENRNFSEPKLWLPSLRPGKEDWQQMLQSLGTLFVSGIKVDWMGFDRDYQRQKVWNLPTYPFQRQRYWIQEAEGKRQEPAVGRYELEENRASDRTTYYQVEWKLKQNSKKSKSQTQKTGTWVIFSDKKGLGKKITKQLDELGQKFVLVFAGETYQKIFDADTNAPYWEINPANLEDFDRFFQEALSDTIDSLEGIIHLWSLETETSEELSLASLEKAQLLGCGSVLHLIQTLSTTPSQVRLWLVTRGTRSLEGQKDSLAVAQSPLWGLGKVIALEHPEYWGGAIDLSPNPEAEEADRLLEEILNPDGEDYFALRRGERYVARLQKLESSALHAPNSAIAKIEPEFSYLITGGLGALGLKVALWLARQGAKNLVLMGRNHPSREAKKNLQALEEAGVKILVVLGDISQEEDVIKVLEEIKISMPPLKGIIHSAGILEDGLLTRLDWERFAKVMQPKVQGTWNLHRFTQDYDLDFFVTFSSIAALLGSPGQGNYAAANEFMDAIASYRQSKGLPALSINWGAFADGMATSKRLAVKGIDPLTIAAGLAALGELLTSDRDRIGVFSVNWDELSRQFPYLVRSPYFRGVVRPESLPQTSDILQQLLETPPTQREDFLTAYLQQSLAQIMQMNGKAIAPTENLLDLGADSLIVMEAINQVKNDLQLMLYPREFYERPKIEALAKYLAAELEKSHSEATPEPDDRAVEGEIAIASHTPRLPISLSQKLPPIAFILSSPRAGSTLLRVMLAGHPDLASPPELHLLPFDTMAQRDKELALSYLGEGLQRAFMELQGIDASSARDIVAALVDRDLPIHEVYDKLQQVAGNRLLIDKSPTYAFDRATLERAEAIFAGAKYIHLVRHPYCAIESFSRLRMDKLVGAEVSNPDRLAETIWRKSNQNILDFSRTISSDRYYQIRYEDLVKNPATEMERLCDFLGISFDSSLLNPYEGKRMTDGVSARSLSVGDPNFLKRSQIDPQLADTWKDIELPIQLDETTRRVATLLKYELPNERESGVRSQKLTEIQPLSSYPMEEEYIDVRGLKLCLCSWGEPNNPLILCLHGILEQGAAWQEVAIRLAQQGYRVVAPDLRGHGKSDRVGRGGSYNLLDFLGDIDGITHHLGDRPFTLVGHSLGSVIAATFASIRSAKVNNLVLVETVLPTEVEKTETVEQLATHLDCLTSVPEHPVFPDVAAAAKRLQLGTPALSDSLAMQLAERAIEPCEGGVRWRWDALLRTRAGIGFNGIDRAKYLRLLQQIKAPITLIYGDKSDFNRPEDLAAQQQAMSQAKRIVVSGGHNLHLEAPDNLAKSIMG